MKVTTIQTQELTAEEYASHGRPFYWLRKAQVLDESIRLLWSKLCEENFRYNHEMQIWANDPKSNKPAEWSVGLELQDNILVLMCFGLENLLKGIYFASNPTSLDDGKMPKELTRGHELTELVKFANIELTDDEHKLCEACSYMAISHGRYPLHKKRTIMLKELHYGNDDLVIYQGLYKRLVPKIHFYLEWKKENKSTK